MTIVVTGAAGFIGSHLVPALEQAGHAVTPIDLATSPTHDIRDLAGLTAALPKTADAVIHLAAKPGVRTSLDDPAGVTHTNVTGSANVLEWARQVGCPRVILASSSTVYGNGPNVEDARVAPLSPYGASKVAMEAIGEQYAAHFGLTVIALRLFSVYGPRQRPDLAMAKAAACFLAGEPFPVYGDGSAERDYTHVDDVVRAFQLALTATLTGWQVFNIGAGRPVVLLDMLRMVAEAAGVPMVCRFEPAQACDSDATHATPERASRGLGFVAEEDLTVGVADYVTWARAQQQEIDAEAV